MKSSLSDTNKTPDYPMYAYSDPTDGGDSSLSQMFDYTDFGYSDATTGNNASFHLLYPAYGGMDSSSKAQPQQNAVFINERGFYSDSFLNLLSTSDEAFSPGVGMDVGGGPDTQFSISGAPYLTLVPPSSAMGKGLSSASSTYALSNPALSDTDSSSFDSLDDVSMPLSSSSYGYTTRQERGGGHEDEHSSVSPESLEGLRTLY
jgi:hypothetical protein